MTPITIPIDRGINRCLAHGHQQGTFCEKANNCARHVSIWRDKTPVPAAYRVCTSELMVGYLPLEGFAEDAEEGGA